jgi:hypothetical protein
MAMGFLHVVSSPTGAGLSDGPVPMTIENTVPDLFRNKRVIDVESLRYRKLIGRTGHGNVGDLFNHFQLIRPVERIYA